MDLLLTGFVSVPALGAVLALLRGEPGDSLNHLGNVLSLVAVSCMSIEVMAWSIRRALLWLVTASLVAGVVYAPMVDPDDGAYLRPRCTTAACTASSARPTSWASAA